MSSKLIAVAAVLLWCVLWLASPSGEDGSNVAAWDKGSPVTTPSVPANLASEPMVILLAGNTACNPRVKVCEE